MGIATHDLFTMITDLKSNELCVLKELILAELQHRLSSQKVEDIISNARYPDSEVDNVYSEDDD